MEERPGEGRYPPKKSKDIVDTDTRRGLLTRVKNGKDFLMKQPTIKEKSVDGDDKDKDICYHYMPMQ
jgi:hypothetical protein